MSAIPKVKITAHEIKRALVASLRRQRGNGTSMKWATFEELRLGSGFAKAPGRSEAFEDVSRVESRIDLFALCTWPSSGYLRRAYEIKVDRGDLIREFDNPDKRTPWLEVVNEFYLVVAAGLTTKDEVHERAPECGLIVYDLAKIVKPSFNGFGWERPNDGLRVDRPPMALDGCEPSWRLVASILRAASREGVA